MKRCPYCYQLVQYEDHLGQCAAVRFALDPAYTLYDGGHNIDTVNSAKYRGLAPNHALLHRRPSTGCISPRKQAGLCARVDCDQPRTHGPYCHAHKLAVQRISRERKRRPVGVAVRA